MPNSEDSIHEFEMMLRERIHEAEETMRRDIERMEADHQDRLYRRRHQLEMQTAELRRALAQSIQARADAANARSPAVLVVTGDPASGRLTE